MKGEPVPEIGVRDLDVEALFFLPDVACRFEPRLEAVRIDLVLDDAEDFQPRVLFFCRFHVSE